MLKEYKTEKLYYGFPIFIIGYQDENYKYNITTCSSSYSLGNMVAVGVGAGSNVTEQVTKTKRLSINLLSRADMELIEFAGINHGKSKLIDTDLAYTVVDEIPVLSAAQIAIVLTVEDIIEYGGFTHFICSIDKRLCDEKVLENGSLKYEEFKPVLYVGDTKKCVYRYVNDDISDRGSFCDNHL